MQVRILEIVCAAALTIFHFAGMTSLAVAQALTPPPLSAYTDAYDVRDISMSPDGRKLALIQRIEGKEFGLAISDLTGGTTPRYLGKDVNGRLILNVQWISSKRLAVTTLTVFKTSTVQVAAMSLVAMNSDGSLKVNLLEGIQNFQTGIGLASIISTLPNDGNHALIQAFDPDAALYKVNVYTGQTEQVVKGRRNTVGWGIDQSGQPTLRYDYSDFSKTIKVYTRDNDDERWRRILKVRLNDTTDNFSSNVAGLTPQNDILVLDRKVGEDLIGLHKYNVDADILGDTVFSVDKYDIHDVLNDAYTNQIIGAVYIDDRPRRVYFNSRIQAVQALLEQQFPSSVVSLLSVSSDFRRYLVYVNSPWSPGSYYVYDDAQSSTDLISHLSPKLGNTRRTDVDIIKYRASDGTELTGYLTFPSAINPMLLPMIVYPHGGPQVRDWLQYDQFAQYWASRGYVVFQPNFRGSTGFGRKFEEAGYQEYGGKILDDIVSGIRAVVKAQYVDPERICAAGASFGGYASLALAAFEPDLIQCAVSINGLSDLPLRIRTATKRVKDREFRQELREFYDQTIGNVSTQRDLLKRHSPVNHAEDISAAVLLIHAEDDENVDIIQSEVMDQALRNAGKEVTFLRLPQGGHSLLLGDALETSLEESVKFFEKHL